ncbi:hypothetical protein BDM02DRAFT_1645974 [Thelephora ganbajun]|uniref:Uncharacterized protein n=1 Tax=Thelephora ganbajun TaxID=370292 RepID=A0ACB6ZVM2_THEGA|nr:hypothetical protein BDM02DRAFT_1645974 [Thelephora ganbajun]
MPASRPSSSKPRKSKASKTRSTSKLPSLKSSTPQPDGPKRFACRAWWCDSTFSRRADMLRHVDTEHFGERFYCIICCAVMKQKSNMCTHLNGHLANYCTICSCGQGFTDPSACKRHRDTTGHDEGVTHGKTRLILIEPVKLQHRIGSLLNLQMISDPSFIPPSFDKSYRLKGMPKPKAQEKYNPTDYLIIESPDVPAVPSTQATGTVLTARAPAAEYQEPTPIERPVPVQTEIQVDELGINAKFSYDVELLQEPHYGQANTRNAYTECQSSPATYPTYHSQTPSDGYHTLPDAGSPYLPYDSYPTAVPYMPTNANSHYNHYPEHYPVAINHYVSPQSQSFVEPDVQPKYWETLDPSQALNPPSWPMHTPCFEFPSRHNFFAGMGFGMRAPNQPQPLYQPNADFHNHVYHPTLAAH